MLCAFRLLGVTAIHDPLNPFPQFNGNQRLVFALVPLSVPVELTGVDAVAQD